MNRPYYAQGSHGQASSGYQSNDLNSLPDKAHHNRQLRGVYRDMNGFNQYDGTHPVMPEQYSFLNSSYTPRRGRKPSRQKRGGRGRGIAWNQNKEHISSGSNATAAERERATGSAVCREGVVSAAENIASAFEDSQGDAQERCKSSSVSRSQHRNKRQPNTRNYYRNNPDKLSNYHHGKSARAANSEREQLPHDTSQQGAHSVVCKESGNSVSWEHECDRAMQRRSESGVCSSHRPSNYHPRNDFRKHGYASYRDGGLRNYSHRGRVSRQFSRQRHYNFRQGTQEDIESQRGAMIEELYSNSYECMVCCDVIRREAAVWNCTNCYRIYHLHCIKKWARSSTAAEDGITGWRCPACQNVSEQYPSQYKCFCGKVTNPEVSRQDTPHSCGEICGKKRPHDCTHPCNILCHPGPCPPCQASVTKYCDCHKTKQSVKCGQPSSVKCSQKCDKILNCGRHQCQQLCHGDQCDPCDLKITQACFCGKTSRTVNCGSAESFEMSFSCKLVCDRKLSCGNHRCDKICHPGPCDDCMLHPSVVTHCPCGKVKLADLPGFTERTSCMDPIPTCENICKKELSCGPKEGPHHLCEQTCHMNACGPCQGRSEVTCRCGWRTKEMTCQEAAAHTDENPFLCETRCNKKRLCGRHKCGKLCCVDTEHKCDQVCGRKLSCGLHRCEEPCHRGNCPTCWQVSFDELRCHCGAEVIYPPIPCGTKPPECTRPCTRPQACGHPVRHHCHIEEQCPPCTELTEKWCYGRHELRHNIHCYQKEVSCGMPCNKSLPCGMHKCQKPCHKGDCLSSDEVCRQPCPQIRAECGHPCAVPCHGTEPCPCVPCKAEVTLRCQCGNREEKAHCMMGGETEDFVRVDMSVLAMTMFNAQNGESVDISALLKESHKKKPKKLECNSQCSIKERNKRLALALEIKNPDLSGKLGNPTYTAFLKDYAKQYMTFVASVELELSKLVNMSEQSKQPKRSHAFKPMNSIQRRVVHELAEYYGCETQSYDEEPNKNVVATAYRGKCWHPTVSLTQLVQRELHPKAPTPIPHHGKEAQIRSNVEASKQSTSVLGAWGKLRPTATTTTNVLTSKSAAWSMATASGPSKMTDGSSKGHAAKLKQMSSVNERKVKAASSSSTDVVIDYFDMDQ